MARPCVLCSSPHGADAIKDLANGCSYATVARKFNVNKSAVSRHIRNHLAAPIQRLLQAEHTLQQDAVRVSPALEQLQRLLDHLRKLLLLSEAKGEVVNAVLVSREVRRSLELLARIRGGLVPQPIVGVGVSGPLELRVIYREPRTISIDAEPPAKQIASPSGYVD